MMKLKKVITSTQEQATAAWINYLNQTRLDRLFESLKQQDSNLENALSHFNWMTQNIDTIIDTNRGGNDGMHGFIAEVAEVGITNARRVIVGESANTRWINDNSVSDIIRDGMQIQQKFVQSGGLFSLNAIEKHLEKYPEYLNGKTKYQIPQDHYDAIVFLRSLSEKEAYRKLNANTTPSISQWRKVEAFFETGKIKIEDIEPSKLDYDSVQRDVIHDTIHKEKDNVLATDKEQRTEAYSKSNPTLSQGLKATGISAALEGTTSFVSAIIKRRKGGKKISEFSSDDWNAIIKETGYGTVKGGVRGVSIYTLTNYTATPAAVANALCTASFGVAEQAYQMRKGNISENDFLWNSEILCLDVTVSALSSFVGQAAIPIPVLGAIIGNAVGMFLYQIAKDTLARKEQQIVAGYFREIRELDMRLETEYHSFIDMLNDDLSVYYKMLEKTYVPDYEVALNMSAQLARYLAVPENEILTSIAEIDDYFQ